MPLIDGRQFASDRIMDAAGHVIHAYYKAPQVTGRVNLEAVVITGEALDPMLELIEKLDEKLGEATKNAFLPLFMDYMCFKIQREQGFEPVILALGADLSRAEMQWDCGACGFPTCAEFNKYSKEYGGLGRMGGGPSCAWKNFDYSMACDYACAAASEFNIENRILATYGLVSYLLGYLDNVNVCLALPLGPPVEFWWYNRPSFEKWMDYDVQQKLIRQNYALHFQMFSSDLRPPVKNDGDWWDKDKEFVTLGKDEEYINYQYELQGVLMETVIDVRQKVEAMREKMIEETKKVLKE